MQIRFAERLKELRIEKSVSTATLAQTLSVTIRTVQYWEKGERECNFDTLARLAKFFDVSTDYLLGLSD